MFKFLFGYSVREGIMYVDTESVLITADLKLPQL